jgi:hypothetical protein
MKKNLMSIALLFFFATFTWWNKPMPTQTFYITSFDRDGFWSYSDPFGPTDFGNNYGYSEVGWHLFFSPTERRYLSSYFVFSGLNPTSVITSAYLHLPGYDPCVYPPTDTMTGSVYGVLQPNPSIPVSAATADALPITTSFSYWTMPTFCSGTWNTSPNIANVLNEIRTQPGFLIANNFILEVRYKSGSPPAIDFSRLIGNYESGLVPYLVVNTSNVSIPGVVTTSDELLDFSTEDESIDTVTISDTMY